MTPATANIERCADSPPSRSSKRSLSEERNDAPLELVPEWMLDFLTPAQDHWRHDDDPMTIPSIPKDHRVSLPVPDTSGYAPFNDFETPHPLRYAPDCSLNLHNCGLSNTALPEDKDLRSNTSGLEDDTLPSSPIPPVPTEWLYALREVARDNPPMFATQFGLNLGADSPPVVFGPSPSPLSGFSPQSPQRSLTPIYPSQTSTLSAESTSNSAPHILFDTTLAVPDPPSSGSQLENEPSSVRPELSIQLESENNKEAAEPIQSDGAIPPELQQSQEARTEARINHFFSLNRAGNAFCAWHGRRKERRPFGPGLAPPGYLNCGCTHEEALFEESLARHGVGSCRSDGRVRMHPSLRNPLLKLLQRKFGYKDGDFESDPKAGA